MPRIFNSHKMPELGSTGSVLETRMASRVQTKQPSRNASLPLPAMDQGRRELTYQNMGLILLHSQNVDAYRSSPVCTAPAQTLARTHRVKTKVPRYR